jgi:hypothetical protein
MGAPTGLGCVKGHVAGRLVILFFCSASESWRMIGALP